MFTYKNAPYKIFTLGPKFCWAGLACSSQGQGSPHSLGLANENLRS